MDEKAVKEQIARKLRTLRKEKGLTLKQLSEKVGCTKSYISQVEKAHTLPSLSAVGKFAAALGVNVIDLFTETPESDERTWLLRKADRRRMNYPDERVVTELLVSRVSSKKMEPVISYIQPGAESDVAEKFTHPPGTEEFVLVLQGQLSFEVNGQRMLLHEGDTLYFDGSLPHRWSNTGNGTAKVLFVFTPPNW